MLFPKDRILNLALWFGVFVTINNQIQCKTITPIYQIVLFFPNTPIVFNLIFARLVRAKIRKYIATYLNS